MTHAPTQIVITTPAADAESVRQTAADHYGAEYLTAGLECVDGTRVWDLPHKGRVPLDALREAGATVTERADDETLGDVLERLGLELKQVEEPI